MNTNEELLSKIYSRYGEQIDDYLDDPNKEYAISFSPAAEMYADEIVPSFKYSVTPDYPSDYNTIIYHDIDRQDKNLTTEVNLATIEGYKFIKVITPFFDVRTFDFIITRASEFAVIQQKLSLRRKEKNEKIIDFPIIGIDLDYLKRETIDFLLNEDFRTYCENKHIKLKRGLVFEGLPGNGKSCALAWLKSRAIENKISYNVFTNPKDFFEEGFNEATDNKEKRIFVFEDFDAFLRERDDNNNSPNQILSSILNLLDGISELKNIVVVFTTNKINSFDSAFLRPGRIDKVIKFNLPTKENILEFFQQYIPEYSSSYDSMLKTLNSLNSNVSFAILKGICDDINIHFFTNQQEPSLDQIVEIIKEKCKGSNKGNIRDRSDLIL